MEFIDVKPDIDNLLPLPSSNTDCGNRAILKSEKIFIQNAKIKSEFPDNYEEYLDIKPDIIDGDLLDGNKSGNSPTTDTDKLIKPVTNVKLEKGLWQNSSLEERESKLTLTAALSHSAGMPTKNNLYAAFVCKICLERFFREGSLEVHMQKHEKMILSYTCPICQTTFMEKLSLHKHVKIHKKLPQSAFVCEICDKFYKRKKYLTTHMKSHSTKPSFKCGICSKFYRHKESLKFHMRTHATEPSFM